ncbi:hypothetical protein PC1C4_16440 [Paraprevotella clara]|jgi:hypothetical protein|uniref:hypothetical protein n=1 Tax=Paraprevotella clara TaxID=454154 RepID=UPI00248FBDFB|nr:hypothetical protein [Paraprevotella clara]BDI74922.1 hypothetical protein PC1C4_16440 [Paraprevotella clara]
MEENEFILELARRMEAWEKTPRLAGNDYADMNRDELIKLIFYLRECLREKDRKIVELESTGNSAQNR